MKPWNAWLYGLGLSGALVFGLAGCGGGDVPDPSADEFAASDEGGEEGPAEPAFPAPEPAPVAAAPAPGGEAIADAPAPGVAAPPAVAPTAVAPAETSAAAAKSETAEMLALATGAASAPVAQPEAPDAGAPGAGGFNQFAGEPGAGDLMSPPGIRGPGALGGPGIPGMAGSEGSLGGPGGLGALGGVDSKEAGDTNSPHGAVKAFLHALKTRDRDRLAEATALRANSDEGGKYREMFARIIESSIADSELEELATRLDEYKDVGDNQVKSTGRQGVIIRKTLKDGGWLQRTVTVRKEKKGWGVLDISGATEFSSMRVKPRGRTR